MRYIMIAMRQHHGKGLVRGTTTDEKRNFTSVPEHMVRDIVERIAAIAHPRMVILFGSAAGGKLGPNSDLNFLVVVDEPVHRRRIAQAIYRDLIGIGFAADIVVVSSDDVLRHHWDPYTVIRPTIEDGQVVY